MALEVRKKGHTFTPRLPRGAGQWAVEGAKVTWYSWPVGGSEDLGEDFVQAVHQPGMGAKIGLQLQRCQLHRGRSFAQAVAPGAFKELYLSLAKHIDRLHGIADQEAGASARGLPSARNQGEQLVLAARRILKLVHQQMRPSSGNIGGQFAQLALVVAQDLPRSEA